jgi:hypothetical protein
MLISAIVFLISSVHLSHFRCQTDSGFPLFELPNFKCFWDLSLELSSLSYQRQREPNLLSEPPMNGFKPPVYEQCKGLFHEQPERRRGKLIFYSPKAR